MAYSGLLTTINLYMSMKDSLTSDVSDIMMNISRAARQSQNVTMQFSEAKNNLANYYGDIDDPNYQQAYQELQEKFDSELASINQWETELQVKKQEDEVQIQSINAIMESYEGFMKNNIKKDCSYGGSSS